MPSSRGKNFSGVLLALASARRVGIARRRVPCEKTPTTGVYAARSACEVSAALGTRLGLEKHAIAALKDANEQWDGRGIPAGRAGDQVDLMVRIVHVAKQPELAHFSGGVST
jgi:hypothetical protein